MVDANADSHPSRRTAERLFAAATVASLCTEKNKSLRPLFSHPVGCQCFIYSHLFLFLSLLCRLL